MARRENFGDFVLTAYSFAWVGREDDIARSDLHLVSGLVFDEDA